MKNAIIIADDSSIIRNIAAKGLEDEYVVLNAANGKEAIQHITNNKEYNIVGMLLDLNMPEYDGFMVLNYFKNNNLFKKYPIAIISGDDTKDTIQRAFAYEIVDMLNKPFSKENVKNMVAKLLANKE